ncbi:hypothetical protein [Selenomonas bovis]|uniref:hypothetical protein n=1 Tax=Selenomonas bovis TaxID=416586 RepID=UPI00037F36E6|nr:hypothetical protein [Selenomonas bovis]
MGQKQFNERLESVIHAARVRFMERLREAYFHGYAEKLLRRYHLADALLEARSESGLLSLEKAAADLLEARIRRARRGGYLAACLRELHMEDLLRRKRKQPVLLLVQRENEAAAAAVADAPAARGLHASLRCVK